MVLGFMDEFDGEKMDFIPKISAGIKKHTLREDLSNRWNASRFIQFCTGVRSRKYKEHFTKKCTRVERVEMTLELGATVYSLRDVNIFIDGKLLSPLCNLEFVCNDGFADERVFMKWFFFKKVGGTWQQVRTRWSGKIIHWTDIKYQVL
jgi:hypothetical protein